MRASDMIRVLALAAAALAAPIAASAQTPAASASAQAAPPFGVTDAQRNRWLTVATAAPVGPEGVVRDEARRPYGYARLGKPFPAFRALTFDGRPVTEKSLRGAWTIVDVWGIWCVDCRRDAPLLRKLAGLADADPDIAFVSIHVPASRSRAAQAFGPFPSIEAYFAKEGGGFPTIVDADGALREALEIAWTPTYLLVGPDLTIHAFRTDLSVGDDANVATALAEAKAIRASLTRRRKAP